MPDKPILNMNLYFRDDEDDQKLARRIKKDAKADGRGASNFVLQIIKAHYAEWRE